jgi:hypothetical protein
MSTNSGRRVVIGGDGDESRPLTLSEVTSIAIHPSLPTLMPHALPTILLSVPLLYQPVNHQS